MLSGLNIKVDEKLTIGFSPTAGKLGVRLSGHLPIEVGDYKLTIYAGVGHDSWTQTYEDPDLWDWLFAQKRSHD